MRPFVTILVTISTLVNAKEKSFDFGGKWVENGYTWFSMDAYLGK
jgi:hypothetical protein